MTNGVSYLFKKNKIDVIHGVAFLKTDHSLRVIDGENAQTYTFKHLIIATGSHPIEIPGFKFGGRVIDSTGVLELKELPKELVIIGGGYIGSELAGAYARFGTHVTILEGTDSILNAYEKDLVKITEKKFKELGVTVITKAMAKEAKNTGDAVEVSYEDIFAIGDIVAGAALAHKASYEGKIAAEAIAGQSSVVDYRAMPAVCYVDPEIATTGLTAAQAKEQGLDVKASKFPFSANGRATSKKATDGFVRLVSLKDSGVIVGAQIIGDSASDMISELTLAIESGSTVEDIALTIHPHPSLSEAVMDAADVALGFPTNI